MCEPRRTPLLKRPDGQYPACARRGASELALALTVQDALVLVVHPRAMASTLSLHKLLQAGVHIGRAQPLQIDALLGTKLCARDGVASA